MNLPPVSIVHYAFQTMVGIGTLMMMAALILLYKSKEKKLVKKRKYWWLFASASSVGFCRRRGRLGGYRSRPATLDHL